MKRYVLVLLLVILAGGQSMAQGGMSDQQVITYILEENEKGTSQQEIITRLMQRGVTMQQLQRVKRKYEQQKKQSGLGMADETESKDSRLRTNNAKDPKETKRKTLEDNRKADAGTSQRIQGATDIQHTYDESDPDFILMQAEMGGILPVDSIALLEQILEKQRKEKNRIFGHDIFNNENLSFEPNMNIATPQDYRLGPGDAVILDIYGASQESQTLTVSPDGDINIEGFGPVQVSGLTVAQANARLRSQLGARFSDSQIRLTVGQTKTILVNVMGEVKTPGTYTLSAFATVFNALYMAGGINDIGTLRNIKVYRNNRQISTVDVYDYILNGQAAGNVRLTDNDVIIVGSYDCLVNVTGKVKRPMFYEMKTDESLNSLLKYAGGFTGDAYKKSVRVVRKAGSQYSVHTINEFDMGAFHLADGDSVAVDSVVKRYSNMVEVKGAVFRPGMFELGSNITTVKSLIEAAEGVTEDAFTAHGVMHRMKADRSLEVVAVDIAGILEGRVADIALKNEDVLFVPSQEEVRKKQTLTIHGEVQNPGIYKFAENETIEDFILQAGGLTETASAVNVLVSRRIVNPRATSKDSITAQSFTFALKDGFVIDGEEGFKLQPFDEVYVRQSPGYGMQRNVSVEGEVLFGGNYPLTKENERLSDLIKKCGGFTNIAYVEGARLERRMNETERLRYIESSKMQKKQDEAVLTEMALKSGRSISDLGSSQQTKKQELEQIPTTYFVGIELDKAIANPGGDDDLVLREGDRLIVPVYTSTVKINGEVMYPNTVGFEAGKKASYYIDMAGGYSSKAKKRKAYIIYMNGDVAKVSSGAKVRPGCEIVVPAKAQNKMTTAETVTLGSGIASIATMIATLANILTK
ncbi:MAG: SLBB domain-containing protein [Prevotella sp.]|nr:SLBB domain-containing protein [Prevotella sp.]